MTKWKYFPEVIYNIPEDDFGYWYEDQNNAQCNIPYHEFKRFSLEKTCKNSGEKVRSDRTCTICINAESTHLFIPCGHFCICEDCASQIMQDSDNVKMCPICKAQISSVHKVYIP